LKHLNRITHSTPARAALFEDILCTVVRSVNVFFSFLGAEEPIFQFLGDKCSFTPGNDS
jgi:hypothetical protein